MKFSVKILIPFFFILFFVLRKDEETNKVVEQSIKLNEKFKIVNESFVVNEIVTLFSFHSFMIGKNEPHFIFELIIKKDP
jgi:hypothetical protein